MHRGDRGLDMEGGELLGARRALKMRKALCDDLPVPERAVLVGEQDQGATRSEELTALHIEAAIASVHAAAPSFETTNWQMLAHHYRLLEELKPTPIVALNAAIVTAEVEGPAAGLKRLGKLGRARKLARYAPYHAARGDLLLRLDRKREAAEAFAKALTCPLNDAERAHLEGRLAECG